MSVTSKYHANVRPDSVHVIHHWEFPSWYERENATPMSADIGKVAIQLDDFSIWILKSHSPVEWIKLSSGSIDVSKLEYIGRGSLGDPFIVNTGTVKDALDAIVDEINNLHNLI